MELLTDPSRPIQPIARAFDGFSLREALMEDAPRIWEAIDRNRDYLRTWLPFVDRLRSVDDETEFLRSTLAVPYDARNIVCVVESGQTLCGLAGFVQTDLANRRTEIGYWLLPAWQGRGMMTACVDFLCRWAIAERTMHRIQIRCAVGNEPSNAIPKRLGFTLEGTERDGELLASGRYADINVYSRLQKETDSET